MASRGMMIKYVYGTCVLGISFFCDSRDFFYSKIIQNYKKISKLFNFKKSVFCLQNNKLTKAPLNIIFQDSNLRQPHSLSLRHIFSFVDVLINFFRHHKSFNESDFYED